MEKPDIITAIIIDDDPFCSFQLQELIGIHAREIKVVATCDNAEEGLRNILELAPALVFLDVEMPGMNGFEMIRQLPVINFEIVFTTSYDHYAIKAIKINALDYLTKPVEADPLKEAVRRLTEKLEQKASLPQQRNIISHFTAEKGKTDALLQNILPPGVADELKQTGGSEAKLYDNVTVLFTDFVNFTSIAEQLPPLELVKELHACFSAFDGIIERNGLEKIKTVGDAYLAVCGLPVPDEQHALKAAQAAMEIIEFMKMRGEDHKGFGIRVGVNSGAVVAGIVGVKKFAYDIWGDTVNIAARMEQHSEPGKINVSGATYQLLKDHFICDYRGEIQAKNKGMLSMYFLGKARK